MVSKRLCCAVLLLSLFTFGLYAQAADANQSASNSQNENSELNQIVQKFTWDNMGDVLKYGISIEKYDSKKEDFVLCYEHETNEEETFDCSIIIEPQLPPGNYRYTIEVYNILGGLEEELTTGGEFIVYKAYRPEIRSVSYPLSMSSTIYLDDLDNDGIIKIEGRNLFTPSSGMDADEGHTSYFLQNKQRSIYPEEILSIDEKNNREVLFQFDMRNLEVGNYNFVAQDSSGLHNEFNNASAFAIKFKKAVDFDISADYLVPIILHDQTFPDYMGANVWPLSGMVRLNFFPVKRNWGYIGVNLNVSFTRMFTDKNGYSIDGNLLVGHARFVYQLPLFRRRFMIELHAGGGVTYFNNFVFHFPHNLDSAPLNSMDLSFSAGLDFQFYINKRLFVELGADYCITFNPDTIMGMVMPFAGVGWQF